MKYKTPLKVRQKQAQYKKKNWSKVKSYMREYMRNWRKHEPGKTIVRLANATYSAKNRTAIAMYNQLRRLAQEDGLLGRGKCARHERGDWNFA